MTPAIRVGDRYPDGRTHRSEIMLCIVSMTCDVRGLTDRGIRGMAFGSVCTAGLYANVMRSEQTVVYLNNKELKRKDELRSAECRGYQEAIQLP